MSEKKKDLLEKLIKKINDVDIFCYSDLQKKEVNDLVTQLEEIPDINTTDLVIIIGGITALMNLPIDEELRKNLTQIVNNQIKIFLEE